jgi:hypothetical protein
LSQEYQGPPATQAMVLWQITAQREGWPAAEHHQGHQESRGQGHWGCCRCGWPGWDGWSWTFSSGFSEDLDLFMCFI